jgi:hypothetical protein
MGPTKIHWDDWFAHVWKWTMRAVDSTRIGIPDRDRRMIVEMP